MNSVLIGQRVILSGDPTDILKRLTGVGGSLKGVSFTISRVLPDFPGLTNHRQRRVD